MLNEHFAGELPSYDFESRIVRDIVDDPLDEAAVRCVVDVAGVVGVKTVAEFVDRQELLDRVREIGIDSAQGFLLHRPEPIDAVLGFAPAKALGPFAPGE